MIDRVGVTSYPVNVTPVSGPALTKLKARLDVMEREVHHLLMAVTGMKNAISRNNVGLANCVMDSRNWTLSVAMSHCYVQIMLGANSTDYALPIVLRNMFEKAANAGVEDGASDQNRPPIDPRSTPAWRAAHGSS